MPSSRTLAWSFVAWSLALPACGLVTGSAEGVIHPQFENGGLVAHSKPLSQRLASSLEGLWDSTEGGALFGSSLVVHGSPGYVSIFGDRDATYAVLQAGCLDDGRLVLEGYHRTAIDTSTGLMRLFVEPAEVALSICNDQTPVTQLQLVGAYGTDKDAPNQNVALKRQRLLPAAPTMMVVAHRGGCRTSDNCGASENSLEMLQMDCGIVARCQNSDRHERGAAPGA